MLKNPISGQLLRFSIEDNTQAVSSNAESGVDDSDFVEPLEESSLPKSLTPHISDISSRPEDTVSTITEQQNLNDSPATQKSSATPYSSEKKYTSETAFPSTTSRMSLEKPDVVDSLNLCHLTASKSPEVCPVSSGMDQPHLSSDEEFFVARKPTHSSEQCKNHALETKNTCNVSKLCPKKARHLSSRRYSDGGSSSKNPKAFQPVFLSLQDHRRSADNIMVDDLFVGKKMSPNIPFNECSMSNSGVPTLRRRIRVNSVGESVPCTIKLPINIKSFSSSCESGADTTSPNTPSKVDIS